MERLHAAWADFKNALMVALETDFYKLRTWRCRLFGHEWGPAEREYEENTGALMQEWHDCQRRGCEGWKETYHYTEGRVERIVG